MEIEKDEQNIQIVQNEQNVQSVRDVSVQPLSLVSYVQDGNDRVYKYIPLNQSYIAYHIRRGDFQQQHTRLESQKILDLTLHLIPGDAKQWVVYIATDEKDLKFFESFFKAFKSVYFLSDYTDSANLTDLNQNHIGMVEQVICANAHTFFGTPLSTFTSYITRMRGYMDRTIVVEMYQEKSSTILLKTLQMFDNINKHKGLNKKEIEKDKESENYILSLLRPKQFSRTLTLVNSDKEKYVGKIFHKKDFTDLDSVVEYTDSDFGQFNRDLLNNPYLFAQRIIKSINNGRTERFRFIDDDYIETIDKRKIPPLLSNQIYGVGIYQRTYYFMTKFMYQLHDKPYIAIPFWTRDFTEPFEDTEEITLLTDLK